MWAPHPQKKKKKPADRTKKRNFFGYHSMDNIPVLLVPNPIRHQITGGYQGVISVQKNPQDFFFLQKNLRTGQITFCETAGPFCPLFPEKLPINS